MIRRRTLLAASAGALCAPAIVERANAQSAFDWKQAKGTKLEVNFAKSPRGDVLQAHQKEFEELTGIKVGSEQIPEQQQRPKVAMEMASGHPSFDVVNVAMHVQKRLIEKGRWMEDLRPLIADKSLTAPDLDMADFSPATIQRRDRARRQDQRAADEPGPVHHLLQQGDVRRRRPAGAEDLRRDDGGRPQAHRQVARASTASPAAA